MRIKKLLAGCCAASLFLFTTNIFASDYAADYSISSWCDQPYVVAWFNSGYKLDSADVARVNSISPIKAYEGYYIVQCKVRLKEGDFDKFSYSGYHRPSANAYDQAEVVKQYNNPFYNCEHYVTFYHSNGYK